MVNVMSKYLIDTHCHLDQADYDQDRHQVLTRCQKELHAVITCCAHPNDLAVTMKLTSQYQGFLFATASLHPKYITLSDQEIAEYFQELQANRDHLVAIGETGLDYNWVKDRSGQNRQKQLFLKSIALARELQLPLVIHSRDATEDVLEILEAHNVEKVQMHMFTKRRMLQRVIANGWLISVNTLLLRSKDVKTIVRDCPLDQLLLETDAPWLGIGPDGGIKPKYVVRNEPVAVVQVAEKVAEIKKVERVQVAEQTMKTARTFFRLT
jgi:TatD DNase family protein